MRFMIKPWAAVCLVVVTLTGVGVAVAEEGGKPASQPGATHDVKGGADVSLTSPQMLARVQGMLPEMEKQRALVTEQLAEAKRRKDVVKVLCLDDKVKQMKLATDTAKDREIDLSAAVSQNDPDRSKHEFGVIHVLHERVQTLVTEAQQCIGEEMGFVGNANVAVNIDPALPDADPSEYPNDALVSEPPVLSSPTM